MLVRIFKLCAFNWNVTSNQNAYLFSFLTSNIPPDTIARWKRNSSAPLAAARFWSRPQSSRMSLCEWYANRVVLLTGVTSEVGHVLLEKILRCLPDVRVYAVLRSQNGLSGEERIKKIFASPGYEWYPPRRSPCACKSRRSLDIAFVRVKIVIAIPVGGPRAPNLFQRTSNWKRHFPPSRFSFSLRSVVFRGNSGNVEHLRESIAKLDFRFANSHAQWRKEKFQKYFFHSEVVISTALLHNHKKIR